MWKSGTALGLFPGTPKSQSKSHQLSEESRRAGDRQEDGGLCFESRGIPGAVGMRIQWQWGLPEDCEVCNICSWCMNCSL